MNNKFGVNSKMNNNRIIRSAGITASTIALSFTLSACGGGSGGTSATAVTSSPESILYNFGAANSGDANDPSADLVIDSTGNLYGTTFNGGANNTGTVFKSSHESHKFKTGI